MQVRAFERSIPFRTKTVIIYGLGGKGAYTAGQCVFVECA